MAVEEIADNGGEEDEGGSQKGKERKDIAEEPFGVEEDQSCWARQSDGRELGGRESGGSQIKEQAVQKGSEKDGVQQCQSRPCTRWRRRRRWRRHRSWWWRRRREEEGKKVGQVNRVGLKDNICQEEHQHGARFTFLHLACEV